jgi:hypothetical protein
LIARDADASSRDASEGDGHATPEVDVLAELNKVDLGSVRGLATKSEM